MAIKSIVVSPHFVIKWLTWLLFLTALQAFQSAYALTVNVVDPNGTPVNGFRYLVEEDTTHPVTLGAQVADSLSVGIHRSYSPLALDTEGNPAKGQSLGSSFNLDLATTKRYMVSIMPDSGYAIGGANVAVAQEDATITVNPLPLPTAQISVLVFHDNQPLNNVPDLPNEKGLEGFNIILSDTAGRLIYDAFGNPLGTTYQVDANGNVNYNADGSPSIVAPGSGVISTDANGEALIKFLAPGKYGVVATPPSGQPWQQTNTIEGTEGIDAWIKADEPPQFGVFGPPNKHVFVGFIQAMEIPTLTTGSAVGTVNGRVVNKHNSAPPDFTMHPGQPLKDCWVGLNDVASRAAVYAAPCNGDSTFSINNVPPGDYQLAVWDNNLDQIFALFGVTVPDAGGVVALDDIEVFRWFGFLDNYVFVDEDEDGFRDPGEPGIPGQAVNLRFRDGSIYQALTTKNDGRAHFEEVFPFFKYLVAEVDFARLKATGATIITDGGGEVLADQGWDWPSRGVLTPQPEVDGAGNPDNNPNTGNNLSRTVTGPVLTQAVQTYAGLTNIIEWGKTSYPYSYDPTTGNYVGENGGISGIVYYATTRAEDDPRFAAAEEWEPGIPRVQVNLYQDVDNNGVIDDLNGDGSETLADVDNHPFNNFPGLEDMDHNQNGNNDPGDAIQVTSTDSWDDNPPTGCNAQAFFPHGARAQDCFEALRSFNQVRDGVFDGGYAFFTYHPGGITSGSNEVTLPPGIYIVEAATPPGYELLKEEDRNVDFGEEFKPTPALLPPLCVGDTRLIPAELSLFPGEAGFFAGQTRPLCDRKQIYLSNGRNSAVDFFLFTELPKAARVVGFAANIFANAADTNSPGYGEVLGTPWAPVAVRDYTGREIIRAYTDEWGAYNFMVPSTYTVNIPSPTGVSPNMLQLCINDSGPIPSPQDEGILIPDPQYDPGLAQSCYTFDAWPGKTTYLDTPVLPIVASAGRTDYPLDCAVENAAPIIHSVSGPRGGPYVSAPMQDITIDSAAIAVPPVTVANPAYAAGNGNPPSLNRDYGFGNIPGEVTLGGVPLINVNWSNDTITGTVPLGAQTGQLMVTRANGQATEVGVTVTVGGPVPIQVPIGGSIQAAIDAAPEGSTILVPPGVYEEYVVLWKSLKLQGWGANSTIIDVLSVPATGLAAWHAKVNSLVSAGSVNLIPQQTGLVNLDEGPGILVLSKNTIGAPVRDRRIDGFTITGARQGGGILVNGYANNLNITNNVITVNRGVYGGGVRIGHPHITTAAGTLVYSDSFNDDIRIEHNRITKNGVQAITGGGIAIYTGADRYRINQNTICGNFAATDGGGIGHVGLSDNGWIANNRINFNQSFQQTPAAGGGAGAIYVAGGTPIQGVTGAVSPGSGSVVIASNQIKGNAGATGDGGAILTRYVNGADVQASPNNSANWYGIEINNNTIVNNIAGLAGAVTLHDTARVSIIKNTIANNDSTATQSGAFSGAGSVSSPQPAGVVARAHSMGLRSIMGTGAGREFSSFSNPLLSNNIIWHNNSYHWDAAQNGGRGGLLPNLNAGNMLNYNDLAVLGTTGSLDPQFSILTDTTGTHASNQSVDPLFVSEYINGGPSQGIIPGPQTSIETVPAFDEGGNFIDINFGPLTPLGDYSLQPGSVATAAGIGADGLPATEPGAAAALLNSTLTVQPDSTKIRGSRKLRRNSDKRRELRRRR